MKVLGVRTLAIEAVHVIRFARFRDHRGYFTEHYRKSDFDEHPELRCLRDTPFVQANESFSRAGTIRGLHFQWNPYMGKLVRTVQGRMIDLVLDIRKGSPTFGKIIAHDMPARPEDDAVEWIWVPPGFAHGNFFTEDTTIEYFCSGQYSPGCEAGISPLAEDIDWSLCDPALRRLFDEVTSGEIRMSDKDRKNGSLGEWAADPRSDQFVYGQIQGG
ncbi:MAG TPA: dTDP-4-keto-6-deoxy-D-glucose epimerase [Phycisphaerales bacterium]|nr:dTDP-4-keto-6-deoxy-D-glucose epimerase [Phycisphaerales bacterium]